MQKENSVSDQQAYWRYTAGTWQPIDDPVPGEPWNEALENAGYGISSQAYGGRREPAFAVYSHRTEDRWLIEVEFPGSIHLVEVTTFPDLVDLTTKLAPLATAHLLTALALDLEGAIDIVREDAGREARRRYPGRRA